MSKKKKGSLGLNLISFSKVDGATTEEKINNVLTIVKSGKIVILDQALTADEEARLVTETMEDIKGEYSGIEFATMRKDEVGFPALFLKIVEKLTGKQFAKPGLTLIGRADKLENITRDEDSVEANAKV